MNTITVGLIVDWTSKGFRTQISTVGGVIDNQYKSLMAELQKEVFFEVDKNASITDAKLHVRSVCGNFIGYDFNLSFVVQDETLGWDCRHS